MSFALECQALPAARSHNCEDDGHSLLQLAIKVLNLIFSSNRPHEPHPNIWFLKLRQTFIEFIDELSNVVDTSIDEILRQLCVFSVQKALEELLKSLENKMFGSES